MSISVGNGSTISAVGRLSVHQGEAVKFTAILSSDLDAENAQVVSGGSSICIADSAGPAAHIQVTTLYATAPGVARVLVESRHEQDIAIASAVLTLSVSRTAARSSR